MFEPLKLLSLQQKASATIWKLYLRPCQKECLFGKELSSFDTIFHVKLPSYYGIPKNPGKISLSFGAKFHVTVELG